MKMNPAFERGPISQFAYISPLYKFSGLFTAVHVECLFSLFICDQRLGYIFMVTYLLLRLACVETYGVLICS